MGMSSEDLAQTLPEEAPQLGDGSSLKAQQQQYATAGGQAPSQGGAPPPMQGPQGAPPTPPVQPPPHQPLNANDMRPGGPVFMKPQFTPAPSWRQGLRTFANHPEANVIRRLSQRADAGLQTKPPQQ